MIENRQLYVLLILLSSVLPILPVYTQESEGEHSLIYWINGAGGFFYDSNNWLDNLIPQAEDVPVFGISQDYLIYSDSNIHTASAIFKQGQVALDLQNNEWTLLAPGIPFIVGDEDISSAQLELLSGQINPHEFRIAAEPGSIGQVRLSGENSSIQNSWGKLFTIGHFGHGELHVLNGAQVRPGLHSFIGYQGGSSGLLRISGAGSSLSSNPINGGDVNIGVVGAGEAELTDGGYLFGRNIFLGQTGSSHGALSLDGTGTLAKATFKVSVGYGWNSDGSLYISQGARIDSLWGIIGEMGGTSGYAEISGSDSLWQINDGFYVGFYGDGKLLVSDGGTIASKFTRISHHAGSRADIILRDPGSSWHNEQQFQIGVSAGGQALIQLIDGAHITSDQVVIGPWGQLRADGTVNSDVLNKGLLGPGTMSKDGTWQVGSAHISGVYTQDPSGKLEFRISPDISDTLSVSGPANLAGELHIHLDGIPLSDQTECYALLAAESITGAFEAVSITGDTNASWGIEIEDQLVSLCKQTPSESCVGDLNNDYDVNVQDLLILLSNWGRCNKDSGCIADINNDGVVNSSDLLILLSNWGCNSFS